MLRPRILVVDDDHQVRNVLRLGLTQEGWTVHEAADRDEMLSILHSQEIDLITLDVTLQHSDGLTLAREVRTLRNIPILMISAHGQPFDRVRGLEHGADDYIAKPFHIREVVLRITRLLGTYSQPLRNATALRFDQSLFDPNRGVLEGPDGAIIPLTAHEQKLFQLFTLNPNRVLSRDQIAQTLTGRDWSPLDRTIDVHVAHLRRKLAQLCDMPNIIRSVRGVGYVFSSQVNPVTPAG